MGIDGLPNRASKVFQQRDVRRTTASTLTQTQSQTIVAPIGAVMAWLKSFTNTPQTLPSGFVECNGQVLSDGDSVYNGQTLPDLNGNNHFLRGNSTSGGDGGAASNDLAHTHDVSGTTGSGGGHNHQVPFSGNSTDLQWNDSPIFGTGGFSQSTDRKIATTAQSDERALMNTSTASAHTHSFSDTSDSKLSASQENRPPFYNVVWIMRIK